MSSEKPAKRCRIRNSSSESDLNMAANSEHTEWVIQDRFNTMLEEIANPNKGQDEFRSTLDRKIN